jgi:hypothetical protein
MTGRVLYLFAAIICLGFNGCNDDPATPPPAEDKGKLHVMVRTYDDLGTLRPNALVSVYKTVQDAHAETSPLTEGRTALDGSGAVDFQMAPGQYYVVATWRNENGVEHTSDTAHVKNYMAGPPPNSNANGPQLVAVAKNGIRNVVAVVDVRE